MQKALDKNCEDEYKAHDTSVDRNNIVLLIILKYAFLSIRLFIQIFFISYYVGIGIMIMFQFSEEMYKDDPLYETFIHAFKLKQMTPYNQTILILYYTFTTLSTVGFGDLHPKNFFERIIISIVLLMGVATFSYIMSIFIDMVNTIKAFNSDFSEGDGLSKFFGLMKRFNRYKEVNQQMRREIEEYFLFKWENDNNIAVSTEEDFALLSQLPLETS